MKKIGERKGDISINGISIYDGIIFSASKKLDGVFQLTGPEVKSQQNYVGIIENAEVEREKFREIAEKTNKEKIIKWSFGIAMGAMFFSMICGIKSDMLVYMGKWVFIMAFGVMQAPDTIFLFVLNHFKRDEQTRSAARFHGAEHAVINAFYDLERVPTLEEVKQYSIFSKRCGSLAEVSNFSIFMLMSIAVFIPSYAYLIALLVLGLIGYLLKKIDAWYFMEFFVVSKPTDYEYNIAIKGISKAIETLETHGVPGICGGDFIIAIKIEFDE